MEPQATSVPAPPSKAAIVAAIFDGVKFDWSEDDCDTIEVNTNAVLATLPGGYSDLVDILNS